MNPQTFLDNFGYIANAQEGVKSIRQLVMGFALAGKFSANNDDLPNDIENLMVSARSSHFIKLGKREKPLNVAAPLIHEFEIPKGWRWVRVGQLCELQTGATPSRQKPEFFGGDIRWLVSGDVNRREIFECEGRITETGLANSNCKILPADSVLIALNGQGKTRATVSLLRIPAACNQSLVAMIPFDREIITPEYLFWALRYRYYEIRDITGQDQRRGLNMGLVSELSVPLAPVAEQKRIVAKMEELMALCDQLEMQQQEREQRFPLLSNTCHAGYAEHPSPKNINRIFDEIGAISTDDIRKTVRTLALDGKFIAKTETQQNWPQKKLKDLCLLITDGEHATPQRTSSGIPLATAKNIRDGYIDLNNTDWVAPETAEKCWKRCKPRHQDVLMVCVGATIGRVCLVQNPSDMVLVRSVALLRPNTELITPAYLDHFLRSPFGQSQIWAGVKQNAQPCLYLGKMKEFVISVPPLHEQLRIVDKVDELMAIVDRLDAQQREKEEIATAFAEACVASFTGTNLEKREKMKAPKTELVSILTLGKKTKPNADTPLATLLSKHKGELPAKILWQQSGLAIDAFYQQLKTEIAQGWIAPPVEAEMKVLEEA